jgi:hypothetical protein
MRGRPPLAWIDDFAAEQRISRRREPHSLGPFEKSVDRRAIEVRLGPVEINARNVESEAAEAIGFGREELFQRLRRALLLSFGHGRAHNGKTGKCHPGLTSRQRSPNSEENAISLFPPTPLGKT